MKSERAASPGAAPPAGARTLRSLALAVFVPALIYEIGSGVVAPIIALTAADLGASPGIAAFMLALLGIGRLVGDVPATALAERVGDRRSMTIAATVGIVAYLGCLLAPTLPALGAALIVIGMSNATFTLARQAFLIEMTPVRLRARAMSTLGGSLRIGLFIGPFLGAGAISLAGLRAAYLVAIAAGACAVVFLVLVPDVEPEGGESTAIRGGNSSYQILGSHRRLFATLGLAIIMVGSVRAARQTVIPLWADHIGLSPEQTSLIFGIASTLDMALFYPSGKVMDQYGRLAIALPALVIIGGSIMALPLSVGTVSLTAVALSMSLGNGISSGIMMTLGADAAPRDGRVRFLGVWRFFSDVGNATGPVVVSLMATAWTLAAGLVAIGSVGLLAAAAMAVWVPRYSPYATPSSVRAHRPS